MRAPGPFATLLLLALAGPLAAQLKKDPQPPPKLKDPQPPPAAEKFVPPTDVEGKTLSQWVDMLSHADPSEREHAIRAITAFGTPSSEVVRALINRCVDKDASPRVRAVMALTILDIHKEDVHKVVDALGKRLSRETEGQVVIRFQAAVALVRFGKDSQYALNALVKGVEDTGTWEIRHLCLVALTQAGGTDAGPDPRAVRALLSGLNDSAMLCRLQAVLGLGTLGLPKGPPQNQLRQTVLSKLQYHAQYDRDRRVAIWALVSLMALEDKVTVAAVDPIVKALKHKDMRVRLHAAQAVGSLGPKLMALRSEARPNVQAVQAKHAVQGLIEMIGHKDPAEPLMAAWALGKLGDPGLDAVSTLNALAENKDADKALKEIAKAALAEIKKYKEENKKKDKK
jgi:HEAT repeat protein